MKEYDVIVVGAGPAGLMTALEAMAPKRRILVLEKMSRLALKLRITGKGRCNVTNDMELKPFLNHFGKNGRFLRYAFSQFFSQELLTFFERLGVPFEKERGGRYFPKKNDANRVADVLVKAVRQSGVEIKCHSEISSLVPQKTGGFELRLKSGEIFTASCVVLATGGKSYPKTGSSGAGYQLAEQLGHTIVPPKPALVPLETVETFVKEIQGLLLKNVTATLWIDRKKSTDLFGEMTFSDFGVSGPIIISLSKIAIEALEKGAEVQLKIDLKPALEHKKIDARLLREINAEPKKKFDFLLKKLLPQKLVPVFCERLKIPAERALNQLSSDDRKRLRMMLKEFPLSISGYRSFEHAIVTAGGVSLRDVEQKTMASKKVFGLYLVGELLDLDADTGGFNLQAAFSTGWLAGQSIRKLFN